MRELSYRVRCDGQRQHFAGRCLPEEEGQRFAVHRLIAIDRHVHLAGVAGLVEIDVRHSDALIAEEGDDAVVAVRIVGVAYLHFAADRHIERVLMLIGFAVRTDGFDGVLDTQRIQQSVFVREVDDIGVHAYRYIAREGEAKRFLLHRIHATGRAVDGQP